MDPRFLNSLEGEAEAKVADFLLSSFHSESHSHLVRLLQQGVHFGGTFRHWERSYPEIFLIKKMPILNSHGTHQSCLQ